MITPASFIIWDCNYLCLVNIFWISSTCHESYSGPPSLISQKRLRGLSLSSRILFCVTAGKGCCRPSFRGTRKSLPSVLASIFPVSHQNNIQKCNFGWVKVEPGAWGFVCPQTKIGLSSPATNCGFKVTLTRGSQTGWGDGPASVPTTGVKTAAKIPK